MWPNSGNGMMPSGNSDQQQNQFAGQNDPGLNPEPPNLGPMPQTSAATGASPSAAAASIATGNPNSIGHLLSAAMSEMTPQEGASLDQLLSLFPAET